MCLLVSVILVAELWEWRERGERGRKEKTREEGKHEQFRILLRIQHRCDGNPEVGDWAPEIWMCGVSIWAYFLSEWTRVMVVSLGGLCVGQDLRVEHT